MSSAVLSLGQLESFSNRLANSTGEVQTERRTRNARQFLWYFATPYTSPSAIVRAERAELATRATAQLLSGGLNVYSPIAAHHPASLYMPDTEQPDHAGWMDICYTMLDRCDGLIVSTMDGSYESKGVRMEIERWKRSQGNTKRMLFASPIRLNEPWVPQFAWQSHRVEGL